MAEIFAAMRQLGVLATLAAYAAGVWVNRKTGKALFNAPFDGQYLRHRAF